MADVPSCQSSDAPPKNITYTCNSASACISFAFVQLCKQTCFRTVYATYAITNSPKYAHKQHQNCEGLRPRVTIRKIFTMQEPTGH